jgi:hypothetical protein
MKSYRMLAAAGGRQEVNLMQTWEKKSPKFDVKNRI